MCMRVRRPAAGAARHPRQLFLHSGQPHPTTTARRDGERRGGRGGPEGAEGERAGPRACAGAPPQCAGLQQGKALRPSYARLQVAERASWRWRWARERLHVSLRDAVAEVEEAEGPSPLLAASEARAAEAQAGLAEGALEGLVLGPRQTCRRAGVAEAATGAGDARVGMNVWWPDWALPGAYLPAQLGSGAPPAPCPVVMWADAAGAGAEPAPRRRPLDPHLQCAVAGPGGPGGQRPRPGPPWRRVGGDGPGDVDGVDGCADEAEELVDEAGDHPLDARLGPGALARLEQRRGDAVRATAAVAFL